MSCPLSDRAYPYQYVLNSVLKDGLPLILRPIWPEDEPLVRDFHRELSDHSVRNLYFEFMSLDARVAHERLIRICFSDYNREWVIVAVIEQNQQKRIIGIGRLMRVPGINRAQFKLIIQDGLHHLGLGTQLLRHLLHIAKEEKIDAVDGSILSENGGMLSICTKLGFILKQMGDSPIIHAENILNR